MPNFIVELRDNKFGVTEQDAPSAYFGLREVCDEEYSYLRAVVARKHEDVMDFESESDAKSALKKMPDEFFDRYWPTIVEYLPDAD